MGKPKTRQLAVAAVLALSLAGAGGALAQSTTTSDSALKGHDTNAPVDVNADRAELQNRADRALLIGNVHIVQGNLTLDAPRVTLAYASGGQGITGGNVKLQRLDASGGVTVRSPTETAKGEFGIYDLIRKQITLVGAVQLLRQGNRIDGQRLVVDLDSGRAVVDGGGPSGGAGRVTGHFTVPQRTNQ